MKKGTIASIVMALIVAANASASKNLFKRESNTCEIVTCKSKGETCTEDNIQKCSRGHTCINNVCVKYADGVPCNTDEMCPYNDDLYCDPSDGKCHNYKDVGAECNAGYECKEGLFCNKTSKSALPGMCLSLPKYYGDPCYIDDDNVDNCPDGGKCVDGGCMLYPSTAGIVCHENVGCNNASLICDDLCKEAPQYGDACINNKCGVGLYCDGTLNKCAYLPAATEDCLSTEPSCAAGLYCNSESKCEALPTSGMPCAVGDKCAAGLYCSDDQGSKTCEEYPDVGEMCLESKCKTGLVCNNGACYNPVAQVGEYCSEVVKCDTGMVCDLDNAVCVVGECYDYSQCK